mmetsp:Transcript_91894/g.210499  ORF Transcript_91894/g.210499 Transcript_91894/m.210499 type:complete len:301 (-) Transcript_91894:270-1172(-)
MAVLLWSKFRLSWLRCWVSSSVSSCFTPFRSRAGKPSSWAATALARRRFSPILSSTASQSPGASTPSWSSSGAGAPEWSPARPRSRSWSPAPPRRFFTIVRTAFESRATAAELLWAASSSVSFRSTGTGRRQFSRRGSGWLCRDATPAAAASPSKRWICAGHIPGGWYLSHSQNRSITSSSWSPLKQMCQRRIVVRDLFWARCRAPPPQAGPELSSSRISPKSRIFSMATPNTSPSVPKAAPSQCSTASILQFLSVLNSTTFKGRRAETNPPPTGSSNCPCMWSSVAACIPRRPRAVSAA